MSSSSSSRVSSSIASSRQSAQEQISASTTTLDTLVAHLLASKRSLSSIHQVYRATSIVATTRETLQSCAIVSARSSFLRRSIVGQASILKKIHHGIEDTVQQAKDEFHAVLEDLDNAEARLRKTMEALQSTVVEEALGTPQHASAHNEENLNSSGTKQAQLERKKKTLIHFVDETPIETMTANIKACIDKTSTAQSSINSTITSFSTVLEDINSTIHHQNNNSASIPPPLPAVLSKMEDYAAEMAVNLESLVRHFDLCVTAIKHTEGGGAAARRLTSDLPPDIDQDLADQLQSTDDGPPEPMTDEQRREMLAVIDHDAPEVEDVVHEISDHISDMEINLDSVLAYKEFLDTQHSDMLAAFTLLEQGGASLPSYLSASQNFLTKWSEERSEIAQGMDDLDGMCDFYASFLTAYDELLLEVDRRSKAQAAQEKLVRDTMARLEKMEAREREEREEFKENAGQYLPADLWWGMVEEPPTWKVEKVGQAGDVPILRRSVVDAATRRVRPDQSGEDRAPSH